MLLYKNKNKLLAYIYVNILSFRVDEHPADDKDKTYFPSEWDISVSM